MLPTIEKIQGNFIKIDINEKLGIWFYKNMAVAFRSDSNVFVSNNIAPRHLKKLADSYSLMEHNEFETLLTETFETCNYHTNTLKRPTNWIPYLNSMTQG